MADRAFAGPQPSRQHVYVERTRPAYQRYANQPRDRSALRAARRYRPTWRQRHVSESTRERRGREGISAEGNGGGEGRAREKTSRSSGAARKLRSLRHLYGDFWRAALSQ